MYIAAAASYQAFEDSVDTPDYAYAYSDVLEGSSGNVYVEQDDPTFAERVDNQNDDTDDDTTEATDEDTDYGLDDVDSAGVVMSDEEECQERLLDRHNKRKAKQVPGKARPARRRATMESGDQTAQQLSTFTSKASSTTSSSKAFMAKQHRSAEAQRSRNLALNEYRVEMELQTQRHSNLAACEYGKYILAVYMAENLAEETDEDEGVYPIRVLRRKKRKAMSGAQVDPLDETDKLPSYETVDAYIKAACDLYESQKADPSNAAMHSEPHSRSRNIRGLMKSYRLRIANTRKSAHAASLTIEDG
ncbi:hypothetical protein BGZ54_004455, partial [Gamsiella multidivaricata]